MDRSKEVSKFRRVANKIGSGLGLMAMSASALAVTPPTALPVTTLAGAHAYMITAGLIAVGVSSVITLIVLSLKGTKLPRRG